MKRRKNFYKDVYLSNFTIQLNTYDYESITYIKSRKSHVTYGILNFRKILGLCKIIMKNYQCLLQAIGLSS